MSRACISHLSSVDRISDGCCGDMSSAKGGYNEVEFLYSKPPYVFWTGIYLGNCSDRPCSEPFPCSFCGMELSRLEEEKRQSHYEDHLSNQGPASSLRPVQKLPNDKKNVFWRPSFESVPPHNVTPNLIPLLKKALIASHQTGVTRKAALCYDKTVHVGVEMWDFTWGLSHSALAFCERGPNYMNILFATRLRVCNIGNVFPIKSNLLPDIEIF